MIDFSRRGLLRSLPLLGLLWGKPPFLNSFSPMNNPVSMGSDDILSMAPPAADARIPYGPDSHHFGDLRLPTTKGSHPILMNIHGGFWRNKYDLTHAGHFCAALTKKGIATWNIEYRRVGDEGGGWPGTLDDVRRAYQFIGQIAKDRRLDPGKVMVMGHSAGGHLALCLAAQEESVHRVISLAGVIDVQRAWDLHLSNNAVAEFLGGPPNQTAARYRDADPMHLKIAAEQWVVCGAADDIVPPDFSREYYKRKTQSGEKVHLVEIQKAGHFDLIDPRSAAWREVEGVVVKSLS